LKLLYLDELKGFYKSKVMAILWLGMPLLSLLMHFLQAGVEELPISFLVGLVVASIGGTLSSVMLSTSIVNEKNRQVYDLFLIRPVKRRNILFAKFLAVYSCLLIATVISLIVGVLIDVLTIGLPAETVMEQTFESMSISLGAMAISCSLGIVIGIVTSSVAAAAIVSIYIGNQLSLLSMLPSLFLPGINPIVFSALIGITLSSLFLFLSTSLFKKKLS
jgi:ABC-2 type transport system permease protein